MCTALQHTYGACDFRLQTFVAQFLRIPQLSLTSWRPLLYPTNKRRKWTGILATCKRRMAARLPISPTSEFYIYLVRDREYGNEACKKDFCWGTLSPANAIACCGLGYAVQCDERQRVRCPGGRSQFRNSQVWRRSL